MKALRVDIVAQRRVGLARDHMLTLTEHQLSTVTEQRLQASFGLTPEEAGQIKRAFQRRV